MVQAEKIDQMVQVVSHRPDSLFRDFDSLTTYHKKQKKKKRNMDHKHAGV